MSNLSLHTTNSTQFNSSINTAVSVVSASTVQTMSSKEIAELTGKRHDHVIRDIRSMLDQLQNPNLGTEDYQVILAPNNMTSEILLNKDLSVCLVSGYNVQLRMAIIKRWTELEAQAQPQFNLPTTFSQALLLAAQLEEQKEQLALQVAQQQQVIEVTQPKADVYDVIANRDNTYTIRDTAKLLKMRPKDLTDWLLANGWIYGKTSATYKPFAAHDRNHLKLVASNYGTQVRVTGKGLVWLARKLKVELESTDFE
ncbi:Rha family transcriptional regulator [Acinetobacter pittii]|uniref:Rha family transcriptional regulator n=1 Tax=Acinetobacter pittii TaxID=48296 RepID=UPI000E5C13A1|nr:phage regulatory protein/antirepressor Ant [Acinetobacter pittii]